MGEKRKVTMTNIVYHGKDDEGKDIFARHEVNDYVPVQFLDQYVTDAKTRWASVDVGDEHDSGPGGDDGVTHYPEHLLKGISLESHLDSLGLKHREG